jgi:hypothetical protein
MSRLTPKQTAEPKKPRKNDSAPAASRDGGAGEVLPFLFFSTT